MDNQEDNELIFEMELGSAVIRSSKPNKILTIHILEYDIFCPYVAYLNDDETVSRFPLPEDKKLVRRGKLHLSSDTFLSEESAKQKLPIFFSRFLNHLPEGFRAMIMESLCRRVRIMIGKVIADGGPTKMFMELSISTVKIIEYEYEEYLDMIAAAQQPKPIPATQLAIDALERLVFDTDTSTEFMQECVICMEAFQARSQVTRMPCKHIFHGDCIVSWLQTSHFCPICRFALSRVDEK